MYDGGMKPKLLQVAGVLAAPALAATVLSGCSSENPDKEALQAAWLEVSQGMRDVVCESIPEDGIESAAGAFTYTANQRGYVVEQENTEAFLLKACNIED